MRGVLLGLHPAGWVGSGTRCDWGLGMGWGAHWGAHWGTLSSWCGGRRWATDRVVLDTL